MALFGDRSFFKNFQFVENSAFCPIFLTLGQLKKIYPIFTGLITNEMEH